MEARRVADGRGHASAIEPWHNHRVRLATFNIKHAELRGVRGIAELLREARPDVVGLQEVDVGCARTGGVDQPAALGTALGMASCFAPALPLGGGAYGTALLAVPELLQGEPLQATVLPLPGGRSIGEEPRVLLAARVAGLRMFVAHFDLPAPVREAQAAAVRAAVGDPRGAVVLADVNDGPDGEAVRELLAAGFRDAWAECGAPELVTAPPDRPQARIDQVLLGPDLPRARSARAIHSDASDHALVVVEL
jgi:endonuclease/exonuclease/phosphatase family metal-dependent hydrolase